MNDAPFYNPATDGEDRRRFAPATQRNREPILTELNKLLPRYARVLEIAAGSGEHAVHFAAAEPGWQWLPSDPDPENIASIAAWTHHGGLPNIAPPQQIQTEDQDWAGIEPASIDALYCANMIHIAPWSATPALMVGAKRVLRAGGLLILYGPFMRDGRHTAPSNEAFDGSLKARDPSWGIRDLADVDALATANAMRLMQVIEMPANNLLVVFERQDEA